MRVLTVRQPWAWAIIHGGKDVENRVRSLGPYRGDTAIHAGLGWSEQGAEDTEVIRSIVSDLNGWRASDLELWGADTIEPHDPRFVRGAVIGVVDLVDVHHDQTVGATHCCSDGRWHGAQPCPGPCSPWAMPGHHHLVLANPRPLPRPIPATGRLGLWRPDDKLTAAITEQLEPPSAVR